MIRGAGVLLYSTVLYLAVLAAVPRPFRYHIIRNLNVPLGGHGHQFTRSKEAAQHDPVDILVFGSSHIYRGFDPRIFERYGLDLFVLGSSNQTPLQYEVLLHRHLDRLEPRLVILELLPAGLASSGLESTLDILANSPFDGMAASMALRTCHIKSVNAGLHAWLKQLLTGDPYVIEPVRKEGDTYVSGGFVQRDRQPRTEFPMDSSLLAGPQEEQIQALVRSIRYLRERKIEVLLVRMPVTQSLQRAQAPSADLLALFHDLAPYADLNGIAPLVDSVDFYDAHHLDQQGVRKFNEAFIQRSLQGVLPVAIFEADTTKRVNVR